MKIDVLSSLKLNFRIHNSMLIFQFDQNGERLIYGALAPNRTAFKNNRSAPRQ